MRDYVYRLRWIALLATFALVAGGCSTTLTSERPADSVATEVAESESGGDQNESNIENGAVDGASSDEQSATGTAAGPDIELSGVAAVLPWVGSYSWTEFVDSDVGSNQTWTHEIVLTRSGNGLVGNYSLEGFQTNRKLEVRGSIDEGGGLEVQYIEPVSGLPPSSEPGETLVVLSGDPGAPTTTLVTIDRLDPSVASQGTYFERQ